MTGLLNPVDFCDVVRCSHPTKPYQIKQPNMCRCLRGWSANFFHQLFQNAWRSRARVGTPAWVGVRVRVRVRVKVGVRVRVGVRVGLGLGLGLG